MVALAKSPPDHYRTLGLHQGASGQEIEEAFHALVREHMQHPDLAEPAQRLRARQVNLAYETLRDPDRRRDYDASLGLLDPGPATVEDPARERPFLFVPPVAPVPSSAEAPVATEAEPEPGDVGSGGESSDPPTTSFWSATPFVAATPFAPAATNTAAPARHLRLEDEFIATPPPPPDEELIEDSFDEPPSRRQGAMLAGAALVAGLGAAALFLVAEGEQPGTATPASTRMADAQTAPSAANPAIGGPASVTPPNEATTGTVAAASEPQAAERQSEAGALTAPGPASEIATPATTRTAGTVPIQTTTVDAQQAEPVRSAAAEPQGPDPLSAAAAPPLPPQPARPASRRIVTPAQWLGGGLVDGDNPGGRFEGTVSVSFTVGAGGNVSGCRAIVSSGNAALDATTCRLVEQRLRFRPALDANGQPIASEVRSSYGWGKRRRR